MLFGYPQKDYIVADVRHQIELQHTGATLMATETVTQNRKIFKTGVSN